MNCTKIRSENATPDYQNLAPMRYNIFFVRDRGPDPTQDTLYGAPQGFWRNPLVGFAPQRIGHFAQKHRSEREPWILKYQESCGEFFLC